MKLLMVFGALVAVCAGTPTVRIPRDNSHYIEGVSRYVWLPDDAGEYHLEDLKANDTAEFAATRNGANNQYWLFTRRNPRNRQILTHNNWNSVQNSNYNSNRPVKVVVHGWTGSGNSNVNNLVRDAFLHVQDCNVIVVDWSRAAGGLYGPATSAVGSVGQHLGDFINWLTGGNRWNNVHLVGHSLGAHVIGHAGRRVGNRPARITGLDPAGPSFGGSSNALRRGDGVYVEAIHTDGGATGIMDPIGRTNFYPNGGRTPQPGCGLLSSCSHGRSYEFFAASVRYDRFSARQCRDMNEARNQRCSLNTWLNMGNGNIAKRGDGLFSLRTRDRYPFHETF